jgi:hypothetical protein
MIKKLRNQPYAPKVGTRGKQNYVSCFEDSTGVGKVSM